MLPYLLIANWVLLLFYLFAISSKFYLSFISFLQREDIQFLNIISNKIYNQWKIGNTKKKIIILKTQQNKKQTFN